MEIRLPIKNCINDGVTIKDFDKDADIMIYADCHDLLVFSERKNEKMDSCVFSLWINCGENKENALMFNIQIDHLEEFASAILKKIDMIRRDYSDHIKFQLNKGAKI